MIAAKNIRKRYADFSLNIDFEIPEGHVTGLIGKNGAGKSTTIKLILPLQLKFGPEKSRIVLMLVIGVVFIAGYIFSKSSYDATTIEQVRKLLAGNMPVQLLAMLIVALVIITVISVLATSKIMNNKEF